MKKEAKQMKGQARTAVIMVSEVQAAANKIYAFSWMRCMIHTLSPTERKQNTVGHRRCTQSFGGSPKRKENIDAVDLVETFGCLLAPFTPLRPSP